MSEAPKVEPLSAEEVERWREVNATYHECNPDCLEARALATIDAERERADRAVELLREIVRQYRVREYREIALADAMAVAEQIDSKTARARLQMARAGLAQLDAVLSKEPSRG